MGGCSILKKYLIAIQERKAYLVEIEAKSKEHARGLAKDYFEQNKYENVEKRKQEPRIICRGMVT